MERADVVTAANLRLVAELEKEFGKSVHYVPDGVDTDKFKPIPRPARIEEGDIRVGWCGDSREAEAIKNLEVLKQAVAETRGVRLLLADKSDSDTRVPWPRMPQWYQGLDVIACVSISEGTPNPVLEGAASGLAILSTPVGIVPEFLQESGGGVLVSTPTVSGVKQGLATIIKSRRHLRFWGQANRAVATRSWHWAGKFAPLVTALQEHRRELPHTAAVAHSLAVVSAQRAEMAGKIKDVGELRRVVDELDERVGVAGVERPVVMIPSTYRFLSRTLRILEHMVKDFRFEVCSRSPVNSVTLARNTKAVLSWSFYPFSDGRVCAVLKQQLGIPYVLTARGQFWHMHKNVIDRSVSVYEEADRITSLSRTFRGQLLERYPWLPQEQIAIIPNGGYPELFGGNGDPLWRRGHRLPLVVCVTNFAFRGKRQGVDSLVSALDISDFRGTFLVAGREGRYSPKVGALGRSSHYLGHVKDVGGLIQAADVFLYNSTIDSQPTVLMEALSAGVPCVVGRSPTSGAKEFIRDGETGLLFDYAGQGVEQTLHLLQNSGTAKALGAAGRASIRNTYSWEAAAAKYTEVLNSLLQRSKRR